MKGVINKNRKTEAHPFRQISVTSFIAGGLGIVLSVILLLTVKSDIESKSFILAFEKITIALALMFLGGRFLWRGYQCEYDFNLSEMYDPSHGCHVNNLLGKRAQDSKQLAAWYASILHSRVFDLHENEKGNVKDWQVIFYKIASKKGVAKLFEYLPYPITNFIASQSSPVTLIGTFLVLMAGYSFASYIGVISLSMVWINLLILIALLSWWRPSKIESLLNRDMNVNLQNRIIFFLVFYALTILIYKSYADEINIGLMISIFVIIGIIIYTSLLSFDLIESVFSHRTKVDVAVSSLDLVTHRASTQPNNILQQFDNVLQQSTGWFFKALTKDARGLLAGDQNRKGDFEFEYVYETIPRIIPTQYDNRSESKLLRIWGIGTVFLCIGLVLFFVGIFLLPGIDPIAAQNDIEGTLLAYSPKLLTSLYLVLLGVAMYYFGNKLVYEIYTFFNTEIFFESNLILFRASGNYDEFEHITGNIKRKDTSTDFTPNIKVCKVVSSIFVHPYMKKDQFAKQNRFLISLAKDDTLLTSVVTDFKKNMSAYMMNFSSTETIIQNIHGSTVTGKLDQGS